MVGGEWTGKGGGGGGKHSLCLTTKLLQDQIQLPDCYKSLGAVGINQYVYTEAFLEQVTCIYKKTHLFYHYI